MDCERLNPDPHPDVDHGGGGTRRKKPQCEDPVHPDHSGRVVGTRETGSPRYDRGCDQPEVSERGTDSDPHDKDGSL